MIIHLKLFSECKEDLFKAIEKGIGIWEVDGKSLCSLIYAFSLTMANAHYLL